ncbi:MAG: membrane protein insertion efficiency factor YidD [Candidatus Omnitrophica bacterium]|nr:membrane protein insertion efficiency factor YidD [Candidatus Omnitrophota bacterium]MCM8798327.1 membrane protein insertion efficiency factor YidD [Candidatus Omnitrophota bacterium]
MLKNLLLLGLEVYKDFFAGLFPQSCRFFPSCSEYMQEAIKKKGIWKGIGRGISRILRCHPFHPGGYDPVK